MQLPSNQPAQRRPFTGLSRAAPPGGRSGGCSSSRASSQLLKATPSAITGVWGGGAQTPGLVMGAGRGPAGGRTPRKDGNKREGAKESLLLLCSFPEAGISASGSAGPAESARQSWGPVLRTGAGQGALVLMNLTVTQECVVTVTVARLKAEAPLAAVVPGTPCARRSPCPGVR